MTDVITAAPTAFTGGQAVAFMLGGEEYALPIDQVREIIRYTPPRRVSGDPGQLGVISLRGRLVPIADFSAHLGAAPAAELDEAKIVIVENQDGLCAGVLVDDVHEVLTLSADDIESVPGSSAEAVDSIARIGDRLVMLLDAGRIFGVLHLAEADPAYA